MGPGDGPVWFSGGRLRVVISPLPYIGGECTYESERLLRGRREAWIAAAGPAASALAAIVLSALALSLAPVDDLLVRILSVMLAVVLVCLFAIGWWRQASDARAGR